jgi:hypothetical protein
MKLIILYTKIIITYIGARSHEALIPRLSNVKRKAGIIMRMVKPIVKRKLTKLLNPIKENADTDRVKSVFPIQTAFNKRRQAYTQNRQSKEMAPDELRCLLDFIPNSLNNIHGFSPLLPFILSSLSLRKPIKNNIFFKRRKTLCP